MSDLVRPTRRRVLQTAGVVGAVAAVTAACGSSASSAAPPATSGGTSTLGPTSGVPVGGGTVYDSEQVVVTQPTAGTFKGFSAVCTHQGCLVSDVTNGTINCPCHGSQFSAKDGSVVQGPASTPLAQVDVKVKGANLELTT